MLGAFDQAGDVGHDHSPVGVQFHDAKLRVERGERIIGHLGPGGGDGSQQRALAGVGHADEADVGDELQFQAQSPLLALGSRLGVARGLIGGAFEMPVAASAFAAAGDDHAFFRRIEIGQEQLMIRVENQSAGRDVNDQIVAAESGHFFAHAGLAAFGLPMMPAGEIEQGILIRIGDENDAAAVAAVAAVGAALGDVFLAPEGDASVPAVAGFNLNDGFIDEHIGHILNQKPTAAPWAL